MSFTYAMIGQVVGLVGCAIGIFLLDIVGRRPLLIYGSAVCWFLLYLASGLGTVHSLNQSEINMEIACFMMLPAFTRISASNIAFLTGAEIGGIRMRKKIMVSLKHADSCWLESPNIWIRPLELLVMLQPHFWSPLSRRTSFQA